MTIKYDICSTISGHVYPISRTYTPGGRVSSLIYPTGRTVDYHRTACACSVDSVTTNFGASTVTIMDNLAYRPFGGAASMDNGAGGIVGSVYNLGGKLTASNPGAEHEMTYGYDNNGNLTSVDAPSTPWYNRVNETPTTYTYYPGTNRLYQTITATETRNYFYDANGNITDIGNRVLTYNQNNRLIRVEEDSVTLGEYNYNGAGQRIIKQAGGVTTVFHYDFDGNIIGESDASGVFSKEYLYRGSNRLVLVDVGTGAFYYYGNDRLGTPQILTDSTNTVVWEAVYKPYGEADVNPNSTVVNNFRLLGQYYDEETGLHYNYFRYYDPGTGRYLTADPIGLAGMDPNLYGYASNNPVNLIDSLGLEPGDVYLFTEGGYAPYIGIFGAGSGAAYGHAAIEISGDRILSAGVDDRGELRVYIRNIDKELSGRGYDVFSPNFNVNIKALDKLAKQLEGLKYFLDDRNVCSEVTAKGIAAANNGTRIVDWGEYLITTSPNEISQNPNFNRQYSKSLSVSYNNKNSLYYYSNRHDFSKRTIRTDLPPYN